MHAACIDIFSAKIRSSTRRTTRSFASWSNFLGIFQIFPSTQTEQNLGHFTPTFNDVYGGFTSYIDGMQLFAHNAPFDSKMIVAEFDRMSGVDDDEGEDEFFPFIDTIDLAKQMLDRGPYNLPALLDRLGLDNPDAHAAVADATATVNMLHSLFGFKRGEIGRKILRQGQAFRATNTWRVSHAAPLLPREI
ncbi:exonuclease domain-containing protein [Corynebacterium sp. LaCa117]|uniref:exonuclease domain-containing protein n=1 Tax=Corynebacterium sp. LaCa117 TaxID=3391424 RepID=UPI003988AECA